MHKLPPDFLKRILGRVPECDIPDSLYNDAEERAMDQDDVEAAMRLDDANHVMHTDQRPGERAEDHGDAPTPAAVGEEEPYASYTAMWDAERELAVEQEGPGEGAEDGDGDGRGGLEDGDGDERGGWLGSLLRGARRVGRSLRSAFSRPTRAAPTPPDAGADAEQTADDGAAGDAAPAFVPSYDWQPQPRDWINGLEGELRLAAAAAGPSIKMVRIPNPCQAPLRLRPSGGRTLRPWCLRDDTMARVCEKVAREWIEGDEDLRKRARAEGLAFFQRQAASLRLVQRGEVLAPTATVEALEFFLRTRDSSVPADARAEASLRGFLDEGQARPLARFGGHT